MGLISDTSVLPRLMEVIEPPPKGRAAESIETLGDADPGEGGYGNIYVTIGHALLTLRSLLNSCFDLRLAAHTERTLKRLPKRRHLRRASPSL